jgi:hypothetical protein
MLVCSSRTICGQKLYLWSGLHEIRLLVRSHRIKTRKLNFFYLENCFRTDIGNSRQKKNKATIFWDTYKWKVKEGGWWWWRLMLKTEWNSLTNPNIKQLIILIEQFTFFKKEISSGSSKVRKSFSYHLSGNISLCYSSAWSLY